MKVKEAKTAAKALSELNESYGELFSAIRGTADGAEASKRLWRAGNKSRLIKIGVALIVFPEPTPISEIVGACFVAAGGGQKGAQTKGTHVEDIKKTLKK